MRLYERLWRTTNCSSRKNLVNLGEVLSLYCIFLAGNLYLCEKFRAISMQKPILKHPSNKEISEDLLKIKSDMIADADKIVTLIAIKRNILGNLNPIWYIVNEICDCLILKKECAAITLTNHLFESSLKLFLVLCEGNKKTTERSGNFEDMYKKEIRFFQKNKMKENLKYALDEKLITEEEHKELFGLMIEYRDNISHDSSNSYVRGAKTILLSYDFATKESEEKTVGVLGNPWLNQKAKELFMRKKAYEYFTHVYMYIMKWDKMIQEHKQ